MSPLSKVKISHKPVIAWALNGKLSKAGLSSQLAAFKECGFGGALIIPWGGLPYAFMSKPWLDMVEWILRCARKSAMEIWIWDDWIFPSGFAGGIVGKEDEDKSRRLEVTMDVVLEKDESFHATLPPRTIVAGVYATDKYTNLTGRLTRLHPDSKGIVRHRTSHRSRVVVVGWKYVSAMRHTVESHGRYLTGRGNYDIYTCNDETAFSVDMLNPRTTRKFLDCIHEVYWKRLRKYFGNTLKGFFYDEPHIPSLLPWTGRLETEFRSRKHYDLTEHLIPMMARQTFYGYDMAGAPQEEKTLQALEDYNDVWTDLMADHFYGAIERWCHAHGVLSIGHQGSDESVKNVHCISGTYFKDMDRSDMPGVDVIFDQLPLGRFFDFTRMAGSRASVRGMKWAMSESCAGMGHGVSLNEMRYIFEHQVVRGLNKFMPKLANYDFKKSFHFHPPELSPLSNPTIRKYGAILNGRTEKLCDLMARGEPMDKAAFHVPLANYYRNQSDIAKEIELIAEQLTYHQREYDYTYERDLLSMKAVGGVVVSAAGRRYADFIIPPGARLHDDEIRQLQRFQAKGCNIIQCAPGHESLKHARLKTCTVGELMARISAVARPLTLSPSRLPISSLTRIWGKNSIATFLLNESDKEQSASLKCPDGWMLSEMNIETGEIFRMDESGPASLKWRPGQSRLILQDRGVNRSAVRALQPRRSETIRLDSWQLRLPSKKRVQVSNPFPSWNELGFGDYSGVMIYEAEFFLQRKLDRALLELGAVNYTATVLLDGKIAGHAVFEPYTLVLKGLAPGKHRIEIEVLNTQANSICGTPERERQLEKKGAFRGTYSPIYLPIDRTKLRSGLFGPISLCPL